MLWVRPTVGNPFTEADVMGGLSSEFENWLKDEHFFSEAQVIEADINWKLAIDTFGENYHFDVLHKSSLANDIVGNLQTWDRFERNGRMVFAGKEAFQYLHEQEIPIEKWPYRDVTLNVYFFYPNCIFLVDRAGIDILKMYPDPEDPAKSKTHHSYYMRPELLDHLQQEGRNTQKRVGSWDSIKSWSTRIMRQQRRSKRALCPERKTILFSAKMSLHCSIIIVLIARLWVWRP